MTGRAATDTQNGSGEHMTGEPDNRSGRSRRAKAPISSHSAFPAIVALWFAALLGLGSLILPISLFESLSRSADIGSIVPAAAPPFGDKARIAIMVLAAIIGLMLGLLIARRIRSLQAVEARQDRDPLAPLLRPVDRHPDAPSKRPILAHAELGSRRFDDPLDADGSPSGGDIMRGDQPGRGDSEEVAIGVNARAAESGETRGDEALDLGIFAGPHEPFPTPMPALPDPVQAAAAVRDARPFEHMSLAELVDRFARSLQGRERPEPAGDTTLLRAALPADWLASPVSGCEGDRPGSDSGSSADADARPREIGSEQDASAATNAAPAALRPPEIMDEMGEAEDGDDDPADGQDDDGFSSLLAMRRSPGNDRQTVWSEDEPASGGDLSAEPVVPFPASAPRRRDPAASEQALREALDRLQRMSGAA